MQTNVQKVKSVRFGSGVLFVSTDNGSTWTNLGALRNASLSVTKSVSEIVFDNARMDPKIRLEDVLFSADLYEINLANLQTIDGYASYTTTAASLVTVNLGDEDYTSITWTVGTPFKIKEKNGNNTTVTSISVEVGGSAKTPSTDYETYVGSDGYTYITPLTAATGDITVGYEYTPNASVKQVYSDVIKTLAKNRFKFVNTDSDGKEFRIEFYEGFNQAGIEASFQSDAETEDAMSLPIQIKASPNASNQLFEIYDEQDA